MLTLLLLLLLRRILFLGKAWLRLLLLLWLLRLVQGVSESGLLRWFRFLRLAKARVSGSAVARPLEGIL